MTPSRGCSPGLHLGLLGDFRLSRGPDPLPLRRPAQRLLAYLAVHRARPVRRLVLAERLWGDVDARRASASLRSALCRLPRPDGRELVVDVGGRLALAPEVSVDLDDCRSSALTLTGPPRRAGLDDVGEGWDAFERDLLPDWDEDWLVVEQESYRQLRLHALEAVSARLLGAGRHTRALLAGLAAVRGEPLRETAHLRVIEVHLAEGNLSEAVRQYHAYRRLIADQLGLAPSPAMRRLLRPVLGRTADAVP